mmetsp:Transcript_22778/g.53158  ORF Transcript_22778/g.53158 Transcript_22778/m.53158 type:complete len:352 (+) Transcript_22778:61-1116(+)
MGKKKGESSPASAAASSNGEKSVTAEKIEVFLRRGLAEMQSDAVRQRLKDSSVARPGQVLIEVQRVQWDELGVNRDVGCAALDHIETEFPGNTELVALRTDFIKCAQCVYLQALQDRKPRVLECSAKMPRSTIIEFFDACNTVMQTEEMHLKLMKHLQKTGQMPNQLIIDAQRDLLEVLGFEKNHGCQCLSKLGVDFPDDKELAARYQQWHSRAQGACMRAVKEHQGSGGQLPQASFNVSPDLQSLQPAARESLDKMTPEERGELIQKMQKKVMVFMNLPPEGMKRYCESLSAEDKLEFVKGQLLLVSRMQQQWKTQQGPAQADGQQQMQASEAAAAPAEVTAAAPQQMMM